MTPKRHDQEPPPADAPSPAVAPDEPEREMTGGDEAGPTVTGSGTAPPADADDFEAAVVRAFEVELAEALRRADEAQARADEHWDRYLRAEAELENQRRRFERLRDEAQLRVRRDLLGRFLEVNDNLELALAHSDADPAQVMAGVQATCREVGRLLAREGVVAIDALDTAFDPTRHEAISVVPVPGLAAEWVIAVERPGYLLNDELLRPARVVVGQPG